MHYFHFSFFHHPWGAHLGIVAALAMAAFFFVAILATFIVLATRPK